jgi:hypothetical protein
MSTLFLTKVPKTYGGEKTASSINVTWTGGVAQVVECLLCKHEILSSNTPTKKKKKNP